MSDSNDTTVDTASSRERIKRALSHGKKGRINKDLSNKIMLGVFRAAAYITTLVLIAIIAYVVTMACRISRSTLSLAGPRALMPKAVFGPRLSRPCT